jgi:hypothetical protein
MVGESISASTLALARRGSKYWRVILSVVRVASSMGTVIRASEAAPSARTSVTRASKFGLPDRSGAALSETWRLASQTRDAVAGAITKEN